MSSDEVTLLIQRLLRKSSVVSAVILSVAFCALSCTRDLPDPSAFISGPGEQDVDDTFMSWILWNYDSDKDGSINVSEAEVVNKIELSTENILSLAGISNFPNLTYLHAQGIRDWDNDKNLGKLTGLDLSGNPKLQHIHLIYNNIKTLKLAECPDLDYLDLDYNEVTELDVKGFQRLTLLQVSYNKLKSIDVSGLDELTEFHCDFNPIEKITLANAKLESFRCAGTLVKELDFSKCPKINNVDCLECKNLTTIKLAKGQVLGNIRKEDNVKIVYGNE